MRWKFPPGPKKYDRRTVTVFALIPRWIDDEVRWLELVTIEQLYSGNWHDVRFVDPKPAAIDEV